MVDVKIEMKDLLVKLNKLPEKIKNRVVKGAVRASAKPIIKEAKKIVPVKTGNLKKSIGVTKRRDKGSVVTYSVSPRKGGKYDGFYGFFLEVGTKKMSPHPFLRPAFENAGKESIKAFKEYMQKRIEKELRK